MAKRESNTETSLTISISSQADPIPVLVAYDGEDAREMAVDLLGRLEKATDDHVHFEPRFVSFEVLAGARLSEAARIKQTDGDILVVATAQPAPLSPPVAWWIEEYIRLKEDKAAALVALFGPEETPDEEGCYRLETVRAMAVRSGMSFFTPRPRWRSNETVAGILHLHVDTTPLLTS